MADMLYWLNRRWLEDDLELALSTWVRAGRVPVPQDAPELREGDVVIFLVGPARSLAGIALATGPTYWKEPPQRLELRRGDHYGSVTADIWAFPPQARPSARAARLPHLTRRSTPLDAADALRILDEVAPTSTRGDGDVRGINAAQRKRALREVRDVALEDFYALPAFRQIWTELADASASEESPSLPHSPSDASMRQLHWFYTKIQLTIHDALPPVQSTLRRLAGSDGPVIIEGDEEDLDLSDVLLQAPLAADYRRTFQQALSDLVQRYGEG